MSWARSRKNHLLELTSSKNLEVTIELKKIFTKTSSTMLAMPWPTTCPLIISLTSKEMFEWD